MSPQRPAGCRFASTCPWARRPTRRFLSALAVMLLVAVTLPLAACTATPPPETAADRLETLLAERRAVGPLPRGMTYHRHADPASRAYLDEDLFSALFGEAARGLLSPVPDVTGTSTGVPPVNDVALYLSATAAPGELAVLRCSDRRTAETVAKLCAARLDTLRRAHPTAIGEVRMEGMMVLLIFGAA